MLQKKNMFVLAAGVALVGLLGIAATKEDLIQYKLGGSWIGSDNADFMLNHVQIPLDPAGKTAALHVQALTWSQATASFYKYVLGVDTLTPFVGQIAMISQDTAKATIVAQGQTVANPLVDPPIPPVNKAVLVVCGIFKFTGPDTIVADYTLAIYPPSADGLPHGDPLIGPLPGAPATLKRVPLL